MHTLTTNQLNALTVFHGAIEAESENSDLLHDGHSIDTWARFANSRGMTERDVFNLHDLENASREFMDRLLDNINLW